MAIEHLKCGKCRLWTDFNFFTFNKFHFKIVAQHNSKEVNYMSHAPFNLSNLVAINIVILNFFL